MITSLALSFAALAAEPEELALRASQQRSTANGELRVKFVRVIEDSRCPSGVACIWEGNARVEIRVIDRRGLSKTFVANTNVGQAGDQFGGYAIRLKRLAEKAKPGRRSRTTEYSLVLSVERLTR